MWAQVEAGPKKYYCRKQISKNLFAWSSSMKREILGTKNFLAPVHIWPIFLVIMDQKMTGLKKVGKTKNEFFHERQPREGIFGICL